MRPMLKRKYWSSTWRSRRMVVVGRFSTDWRDMWLALTYYYVRTAVYWEISSRVSNCFELAAIRFILDTWRNDAALQLHMGSGIMLIEMLHHKIKYLCHGHWQCVIHRNWTRNDTILLHVPLGALFNINLSSKVRGYLLESQRVYK